MSDEQNKNTEGFEEKIFQELYKIKSSDRAGKIKKIWGVRKREPESIQTWDDLVSEDDSFLLFRKNIKKLFGITFLLFLLSVGVFTYIFYYRAIYIKGVNLNILGAEDVNSLEEYEYIIKIENNSNHQLVDSKLEINLDNGVFFADDLENNKKIINIGELQPKASRELKVNLFFIGNLNEIKKIKATYIYYTPKKNQEFITKKELNISIKKEPITLQVYSPSKVFVNEPFNFSLKISNNSSKSLGFKVNINFQGDYEAEVISPPYDRNFDWTFVSVAPNNNVEISIIGRYLKYISNPLININLIAIYSNKMFPLKTQIVTINVLESPIVLEIESQPESNVVGLGSNIKYTIKWVNKSTIPLENVKLKVSFEGPFDYSYLYTDGYFDPYENSIVWDARNKPSLLKINPGSSDSVSLSINTAKEFPLGKKNLEIKVKAILETESIPPEVQVLTKKLSIDTQLTKRIHGKVNVEGILLYNDPQIKNIGPFPLVNGKSTTLSFYLNFYTYGEDFQNIIIKTKIPIGVKLTGITGGNFNINNLQYSPNTGDFIYQINELSAGYGTVYEPYTIGFQVEVTPPVIGDPNNFIVIAPIEITGQGKFSGESFTIKMNEFTARLTGFIMKY